MIDRRFAILVLGSFAELFLRLQAFWRHLIWARYSSKFALTARCSAM